MKVLVDTNILIDAALERQPFFENSLEVLTLIHQGQLEDYISASTISDLYYIVRCKTIPPPQKRSLASTKPREI